jgi:hypothetical protein
MTGVEMSKFLKELKQPNAVVYFEPTHGNLGLYDVCQVKLIPDSGNPLPRAVLMSAGSLDPIDSLTCGTLQDCLRKMPEGAGLFYDDSHEDPLAELVPVLDVKLLNRADLDSRGRPDVPAPAILLSSRAMETVIHGAETQSD